MRQLSPDSHLLRSSLRVFLAALRIRQPHRSSHKQVLPIFRRPEAMLKLFDLEKSICYCQVHMNCKKCTIYILSCCLSIDLLCTKHVTSRYIYWIDNYFSFLKSREFETY